MAAATPIGTGSAARPVEKENGLRHLIGNILVAGTFFVSAFPNARNLESGANLLWVIGAVVMGVLSLVRIPPTAAMMDWRAFVSSIAAFVLPCLVRPSTPSIGIIAWAGIGLEFFGTALSQVARIYLGRSFGVLPGNRGIVSNGPFRVVRHPIYVGWLLLTLGYVLAYPSGRNFLIMVATAPFMMWRIFLEEELLAGDPTYRAYQAKVRFRLAPGLF